MKVDPEFEKILIDGYRLVTVNVLYYLPDQRNLVNEFIWQALDLQPKYPRVHKFLDFWQAKIEARIKEVRLNEAQVLFPRDFRTVKKIYTLD